MRRASEDATRPPLPRELQVEITGACNLRCRMCLVRYAPAVGRTEGALSYEDFLALVDELPELRRLTLQGLGEPLLSPHLEQMVAHAAARGIEVGFNTNGTLLTPDKSRRLVAAGLGWLHVSLDGATAQTYADVRHGTDYAPHPGQFERVVANLRALVAERGADRSARPRILLVFVAMRRNVHELEDVVRLGADVGVDEVWVQNLSHTFVDTADRRYDEMRRYAADEALFGPAARPSAEIFERARQTGLAVGVEVRLPTLEDAPNPRRRDEPGCSWPWDSAYVTHRGVVQPCCMIMGSDRASLGRLNGRRFSEVWHDEPYRDFRARLMSDDPPAPCHGCSLYRGVF